MKRKLLKIQRPLNNVQFVVDRELRKELQPLVFFDAGKFTRWDDALSIGAHPHSGIGIITYFHGTDLHHKDSGHNDGIIKDGGVQWINAGGGIWHEENYHRNDLQPTGSWSASIHQLWIQLPSDQEEGPVAYMNLAKEEIPQVENVKVLAGNYKGVAGKVIPPVDMTYLDVHLHKGEDWIFPTPDGQTTGFVFTRDGSVSIHENTLSNGLMGVLEHTEGEIHIRANEETNFIVVLAKPTNQPIITSGGQIHTNQEALQRSKERIMSQAH